MKRSFLNQPLINHCIELFPINRSLMGKGNRETLDYFEKYFPNLERLKFSSGQQVNDWEIPLEWVIKDAYLEHLATKKKFCQFTKNNLHLLGYSVPINKIVDFEDLKNKIYYINDYPEAIPYRTSYYKKDWGFCTSKNDFDKMPKGKYKVFIDSEFIKGSLDLSHTLIEGNKEDEIMFTSYICHPSMANNELSGPTLLGALIEYIKKNHPKNYYSYRFLLGPETLGPISYLSKFNNELQKNIKAGFVLTCLGDDGPYSIVQSPYKNTFADEILLSAIYEFKNKFTYNFLERGSDERQFCAPNVNLPFCTFSRSKFESFREYHTSEDNLSFISEKGLRGSFEVLKTIVDVLEKGIYIKSSFIGEPQLGKRNLYRSLSVPGKSNSEKNRLNIIAYANGKNSIFRICNICKIPLSEALREIMTLEKHGIIKCNHIQNIYPEDQ